jgi:hypothetical protein
MLSLLRLSRTTSCTAVACFTCVALHFKETLLLKLVCFFWFVCCIVLRHANSRRLFMANLSQAVRPRPLFMDLSFESSLCKSFTETSLCKSITSLCKSITSLCSINLSAASTSVASPTIHAYLIKLFGLACFSCVLLALAPSRLLAYACAPTARQVVHGVGVALYRHTVECRTCVTVKNVLRHVQTCHNTRNALYFVGVQDDMKLEDMLV